MEVRTGYKQTEVGLIPDDWCVTTVGDISEVKTGPFGTALHEKDYVTSGTPIITVEHLGERGVTYQSLPLVSGADTHRLRAYSLRRGDIVFSRVGSVDRNALITATEDGWLFSGRLLRVRPARERVNPQYLSHHFHSEAFKQRVRDVAVGQTMASINTEILKRVEAVLPSTKAEQEAIAHALSDADALIESLEQLIAKKRQLKRGAMQELLTGKRRLPGFSQEWVVKPLAQLASIRSGGTPSTSQPRFWDGGILWCTPTDITALNGFKYLSNTKRTISHEGLESSSADLIPPYSVVMTSRATIGECAINRVPVTTNQGFKNFVPVDTVDVEFLYYLLLTQKPGFINLCGGSTFLEIGKTQLASFEVRLPATESEQSAIAAILSDMDTELAALETKLAKARQIKQGMMQELLTGRIRLA